MDKRLIGAKLRQAREEAKLNQKQLAERLGKSQKTISNYETGEHGIDIEELPDFARELGKPIGYFFSEENPAYELPVIYGQLSEEDQQKLLEYAQFLLFQHRNSP